MSHHRDIDHPEGYSEGRRLALAHRLHLFAGHRRIEPEHFVDPLLMVLPADPDDPSFASALEGA